MLRAPLCNCPCPRLGLLALSPQGTITISRRQPISEGNPWARPPQGQNPWVTSLAAESAAVLMQYCRNYAFVRNIED